MHDGAAAESFRDLTLDDFVQRLASAEPVPGGGSASGVAAALAAALVSMVAALSEGREKYAAHADVIARASLRGRVLADEFLRLADEDAAAYAAFGRASRLSKDTDADRHRRTEHMRAAARGASEVPLACVEACAELVGLVESLAGRSNLHAASDLGVAAMLAEAAARGAAANVLVNLPAVDDPDWADAISKRVDGLLHEIDQLAATTREVVATGELREPLGAAG